MHPNPTTYLKDGKICIRKSKHSHDTQKGIAVLHKKDEGNADYDTFGVVLPTGKL